MRVPLTLRLRRRFAFAGISSLALMAAPALAQVGPAIPEEEEPTNLHEEIDAPEGQTEIIVTAQFREQRLQDTPIAITAVNAEMLNARSQTNISEITAQAPSVTLKPQGTLAGKNSIGGAVKV